MCNFTSKKEQNLWVSALVVFIAIYASLFLGGRFINFMVERRIIEQSTFYLFLILIVTFLLSGWRSSTKRLEYWVYAGVIAVYGMALLRMDLTSSERSHMFEYGLLSILLYEAMIERRQNGVDVKLPMLASSMIAGSIGLLDECIQYFLPYRVFDYVDIGFNYLASAMGVLMRFSVSKLQRLFLSRNKKLKE